jgi:hypothetical protein
LVSRGNPNVVSQNTGEKASKKLKEKFSLMFSQVLKPETL